MSHLQLVVGIGKVLFFPWAMLSLQHCCRNSLCSQGLQESFWTAFLTTGPARNFLQLKSISWPRFFLKFLDVWLPIVWGFHRWLNLFQSHKLCSRNDGVLSEQIFFSLLFLSFSPKLGFELRCAELKVQLVDSSLPHSILWVYSGCTGWTVSAFHSPDGGDDPFAEILKV